MADATKPRKTLAEILTSKTSGPPTPKKASEQAVKAYLETGYGPDLRIRTNRQAAEARLKTAQERAKSSHYKVVRIGTVVRPDGTKVPLVRRVKRRQLKVPTREPSYLPTWFSSALDGAEAAGDLPPGHSSILRKLYKARRIPDAEALSKWVGHLKENAWEISKDPHLYRKAAQSGVLSAPGDLKTLNKFRVEIAPLRDENQRLIFEKALLEGVITPSNYSRGWDKALMNNRVRNLSPSQAWRIASSFGTEIKTPEHLSEHVSDMVRPVRPKRTSSRPRK